MRNSDVDYIALTNFERLSSDKARLKFLNNCTIREMNGIATLYDVYIGMGHVTAFIKKDSIIAADFSR